MLRTTCWMLLASLTVQVLSARCAADEAPVPHQLPSNHELIRKWQDMRFGMFIHWGPVSLKGTEIGWSRGQEVASEEYDKLYLQFNPTAFDANSWVQLAKDAGMKYLVITSKHHDGFCLWDSQLTDYDIMSTPFRRDVLRELADACKRQGIIFCTYHSICDWRHPDYPLGSPGGQTTKPNPNMDRYLAYLQGQLRELIEGYGPLGILWFDGEWEAPWTHQHGLDLYRYVRSLQPDILINNRVDKGRRGMQGTTTSTEFAGDYDTPEQEVGAFNRQRPWETCMTICRQWAWKPDDELKSLPECLQTLIYTIGGDGNLLLNVGPMPDGRIEPRQAERLREMGRWLGTYGDAIYGTRGGPFQPGPWGASTCKADHIYLFVTQWPATGPLILPAIGGKIVSSKNLCGGEVAVQADPSTSEIQIQVPESDRDPTATVIRLTIQGHATEVAPVAVP